jgi:hypothetical protein
VNKKKFNAKPTGMLFGIAISGVRFFERSYKMEIIDKKKQKLIDTLETIVGSLQQKIVILFAFCSSCCTLPCSSS